MAYRNKSTIAGGVMIACAVLLTACSRDSHLHAGSVARGANYVAMGSSFAAGPGVAFPGDLTSGRCARSTDNYAHLLARDLGLRLTDASCSGATTAHVLGPWKELPPQLDALTRDTGLVTITIGGNDVGYIGTLGSASCRNSGSHSQRVQKSKCPVAPTVISADWATLEASLLRIVWEIHRRAPAARTIFVDYLSVLPPSGTCAAVPLTAAEADASRATARRLAKVTAHVAEQSGVEVFKASNLSTPHSACSADPWTNGYFSPPGSRSFVPYHPNARGMTAIADGLSQYVQR